MDLDLIAMKVIDSLFKAYNITMASTIPMLEEKVKNVYCFTLGFRICVDTERIGMTLLVPDLCVGILDPDPKRKIKQKLLR
jgi:hypothetical protein